MSRHLHIARADATPADWRTNENVPAELEPDRGEVASRERLIRQSRIRTDYEPVAAQLGGMEYHARGATLGVTLPPNHLAKHGPWDTPTDSGIDW